MAFKDPRCSACEFLERKRLQAHWIHFTSLTVSGLFTMKVRFTDSITLLVETEAFDQSAFLPQLASIL